MQQKILKVKAGTTIYASTGRIGYNQPSRMSSWNFYKAVAGSRLHLLDKTYYYNVATYTMDYDPKYIYTYDYEPEQSWTTYARDLRGDTYIQEDYVFEDERYFRVCLKKVDGAVFTEAEAGRIQEIITFTTTADFYKEKEYFKPEIEKTAEAILGKRTDQSVVFAVLTDSHYTINGTWEDTAYNIKAVHEKVGFDAIIHLGDLTDGMVPAEITKRYVQKMIVDLQRNQAPVHIVLGNHDANYFHGNPEPFSVDEQCELYQNHNEEKHECFSKQPYYYVDYDSIKLRCIFLVSFDDSESVRYGFSAEQLVWVEEALAHTPAGYAVMIFSHVAPLAKLDFWSDEIRNGEQLVEILEKYNRKNEITILAYVHGHTHADYCYTKSSFPIVSIGCNKCEYMLEKKKPEMVTPERNVHTVTQDLWDAMIINPAAGVIDFIRFGAGQDRHIIV